MKLDWNLLYRLDCIKYDPKSWQKIEWVEAIPIGEAQSPFYGYMETQFREEKHWCFGWPFYPYRLENNHRPPPPSTVKGYIYG